MGPAYYVRSILAGKSSIDRIWRDSPTLQRQPAPVRQPPQPGLHRPDGPDSAELGLLPIDRPARRPRGAPIPSPARRAARSGADLPPLEPTPRRPRDGVRRPGPRRRRRPPARRRTSRSRSRRAIRPFSPTELMVAVRWDPLDGPAATVPAAPASPPAPPPAPEPSPPPAPRARPSRSTSSRPRCIGEVVAPVAATRTAGRHLRPGHACRRTAGLYRLVGTIHGTDGVAYDAATQALMPALIVRVTGSLSAPLRRSRRRLRHGRRDVQAAGQRDATSAPPRGARGPSDLARRRRERARPPGDARRPLGQPRRRARRAAAARKRQRVLPPGLAPGSVGDGRLRPDGPDRRAGDYLLLLDVVTPQDGSLAGRRRAARARPGHRQRSGRRRPLRDPRRPRDRRRPAGRRGLRAADPDRGPAALAAGDRRGRAHVAGSDRRRQHGPDRGRGRRPANRGRSGRSPSSSVRERDRPDGEAGPADITARVVVTPLTDRPAASRFATTIKLGGMLRFVEGMARSRIEAEAPAAAAAVKEWLESEA